MRNRLINAINPAAFLRVITSLILFYGCVEVETHRVAYRIMGDYALLIEANKVNRNIRQDAALFNTQSMTGGAEILPASWNRARTATEINMVKGAHEVSVSAFNKKVARIPTKLAFFASPVGSPLSNVLPQGRTLNVDLSKSAAGSPYVLCTAAGGDFDVFKGSFIGKVNGATFTNVTVQSGNAGDSGNTISTFLGATSAGSVIADKSLPPFTAGPVTIRNGSTITYTITGSTGTGSLDATFWFSSTSGGSCQP